MHYFCEITGAQAFYSLFCCFYLVCFKLQLVCAFWSSCCRVLQGLGYAAVSELRPGLLFQCMFILFFLQYWWHWLKMVDTKRVGVTLWTVKTVHIKALFIFTLAVCFLWDGRCWKTGTLSYCFTSFCLHLLEQCLNSSDCLALEASRQTAASTHCSVLPRVPAVALLPVESWWWTIDLNQLLTIETEASL